MSRFLLLAFFIFSSSISSIASQQEGFDPNDPGNWDQERVVRLGKAHMVSLVGFASYHRVKEYLKDTGLKPKLRFLPGIFGKTVVTMNFAIWEDIEGCGCPEQFNEFNISYDTNNPQGLEGKDFLSPNFTVSSEKLRVNSLIGKFGVAAKLGKVELNKQFFSAKSDDGELSIQVRLNDSLEKISSKKEIADIGSYTLGGVKEEYALPQSFFRLYGSTSRSQSLFSFNKHSKRPEIIVDPNSKLGMHLKDIGFKPIMWEVNTIENGWAWLP